MPNRAEDSTTAGLFFARRGSYTFPCRRCGRACLSAGAGHADDIEEVAHHAKIVGLAPCSAASTRLARGRRCCRNNLIWFARLCDRRRELRSDQQHKRSRITEPSDEVAASHRRSLPRKGLIVPATKLKCSENAGFWTCLPPEIYPTVGAPPTDACNTDRRLHRISVWAR